MFRLVLVCGLIAAAHGYGSGAPASVCEDMTPKHPTEPQPSNTYPYVVRVDKAKIKAGESVKVTVSGKKGETFQGFFLQARVGNTPIGQFTPGSADAKTVDCGTVKKNAVTHANPSVKKTMSFTWTSPKDLQEAVDLYATVAENGGMFWVAQKGPRITVI